MRREFGAAHIKRSAGVDDIEIGEGTGVVIAVGQGIDFVAHPDIGEGFDVFGPGRTGFAAQPAFGFGFGAELVAHFVADAVAHGFGNVGDADFAGQGSRGWNRRWRAGGSNIGVGQLDEFLRVFLSQGTALHKALQEIDGKIP